MEVVVQKYLEDRMFLIRSISQERRKGNMLCGSMHPCVQLTSRHLGASQLICKCLITIVTDLDSLASKEELSIILTKS